ncbi:FimV/HubP family polar landmark protein [Vibrio parahaemolyticus]|uniref:FimV/HubP family polar landmark protein n=1 Tax=Vibrio parahaemolyticus TaxID=670 RepID=UPI0006A56FD2|nr:FimV/HubP family polar landmark protein [Vibrio parahaemolyticus]KOF25870.1 hypothetical protein ACX04_23215 [Vibrio parahaemolyticus]ODW94395.1 hypothetical protein BBM90_14505 [Vibrio parahaemolyticus]OTW13849.1 hypothetical protein BA743_23100 [Vibrio parahaemolyticus]OTW26932.1 hypothetical protein BA744_09555 [Vibrio parahaemolyticus]
MDVMDVDQNVAIGLVNLTINTPDCLGHQSIWPLRDELVHELIDEINSVLKSQYKHDVKINVINIEPGSIKAKLEVAAYIATIFVAADSVVEKINAFELGNFANELREEVQEIVSNSKLNTDPNCVVSIQAFKKRGLCYGPVEEGDSLSEIVLKLSPQGVSLNQAMIALYTYNRDAFFDDNINYLKAGAFLSLPKSPKYFSKVDADALVQQHNKAFKSDSQR